MKRVILTTIALSVAGLLFSGCGEKTPPPKPKVVKAKPAPKPKPVKPVKEAKLGTPAYLDAKYGFRDLNFGTASGSLSDLTLVEDDAAQQLKTYTRANEQLMLGNVPLKKIEYTFFEDKLCQITLYWEVQYPSSLQGRPESTELSGYCTTLYGKPALRQVNKDNTYYVWHGQKAGLMLTENLLHGVRDVAHGTGWALSPSTTGIMVIYSEPLRRSITSLSVKQTSNGI